MRWQRGHTGGIEDRRGMGGGGMGMGGLGGIPIGVGGGGGLILVLIFLAIQFFGGGLTGGSGGSGGAGGGGALDPFGGRVTEPGASVDLTNNGDQVEFLGYVLDDANALWRDVFERTGKTYEDTVLVLFDGSTQSGCGPASSQTGPFYCPLDQKVYIDLGFYDELRSRFGAPGDFAQAYVIAHEVGHHVQTLLGINQQVQQQSQQDPNAANGLSVAMELQADCLAGVWAQSVFEQGDLEQGDLEEGLNAASSVGDDRIQASAGAAVNPETWTHGSAEQRSTWFRTGFDSGDPASCDTFGG